MNITIENNQIIVNLDEAEFIAFEVMFDNLHLIKQTSVEFREFGSSNSKTAFPLLPMHLCRTIGEANLAEDPFATVSLYPFWKHGFEFGGGSILELLLQGCDPHKKAVAADEFGMGFCCWAMEEIFKCDSWADTSALIKKGAVFPVGSKRPDFVCGFPDGTLGVFEAKGTTGTAGNLTGPLADGKKQTQGISADDPIKHRVAVGCALDGRTKIIMLDPEPEDTQPTNLTAALVTEAAREMRRVIPLKREGKEPSRAATPVITIFCGPDSGTDSTREIALKHENYREDKKHGWLDFE